MSKTVIIWNDIYENDIKFVVIDKDVSHLNGVYINSNADESKVEELDELMFAGGPHYVVELLDEFPVDAVKDGAKVIVAGFMP